MIRPVLFLVFLFLAAVGNCDEFDKPDWSLLSLDDSVRISEIEIETRKIEFFGTFDKDKRIHSVQIKAESFAIWRRAINECTVIRPPPRLTGAASGTPYGRVKIRTQAGDISVYWFKNHFVLNSDSQTTDNIFHNRPLALLIDRELRKLGDPINEESLGRLGNSAFREAEKSLLKEIEALGKE